MPQVPLQWDDPQAKAVLESCHKQDDPQAKALMKLRPVRNAPSDVYQLILLLLYASNPATGGMLLKRSARTNAYWHRAFIPSIRVIECWEVPYSYKKPRRALGS